MPEDDKYLLGDLLKITPTGTKITIDDGTAAPGRDYFGNQIWTMRPGNKKEDIQFETELPEVIVGKDKTDLIHSINTGMNRVGNIGFLTAMMAPMIPALWTAPGLTLAGLLGGTAGSGIGGGLGLLSDRFLGTENGQLYGNILGGIIGGLGYAGAYKMTRPMLKSNALLVYDKFAPKTNRVIKLPNESSYKLLTPEAKHVRDKIFFREDYNNARASGQYPETFSERRQYLTKLNNDFLGVRNRLILRRVNDYNARLANLADSNLFELFDPLRGYSSYEEMLKGELPMKITYTSREGHVPLIPKNADGINYSPKKAVAAIRRENSLLPLKSERKLRGLSAHELDHSVQDLDYDFGNLITGTTPEEQSFMNLKGINSYHTALDKHSNMFNDYAPVTEEYRGSWFGSPNEINSEMQNILELLGTTKSYRDLNLAERNIVDKFMSLRFDVDINTPVWLKISSKGYFKQGGNIIKKFKNRNK